MLNVLNNSYNSTENNNLLNLRNDDLSKVSCFWYSRPTDSPFEYENRISNEIYYERYAKDYNEVTDCYVNKVIGKSIDEICFNEEINVLLLGCGNLYEVLSFVNEFDNIGLLRNKKINFLCLDECFWPVNYLDSLLEKIEDYNISVWFHRCDFIYELDANTPFYKNFDIIYASRCINPLDKNKSIYLRQNDLYAYTKKILGFINIYQPNMFVLSQVTNSNNNEAFEFEKNLQNNIQNHYQNAEFYQNTIDEVQEISIYRPGLNYYLYII